MTMTLLQHVAYILTWPVMLLPKWCLTQFPALLLKRYVAGRPPAEGLRVLFELDEQLYALQGRQAVRYGGGLHTKHRHTGYHDFFVARIGPDDHVLDVGCGLGAVAFSVAQRTGAQVTGIDYVPSQIAIAKQRYSLPNLEFFVADATEALPEGTYQVVILSNVLEHIVDRPGLLRALQQAVSPDRFLIRVPLFERDWRVPLKKELGVEWRLDRDHKTEYSVGQFREEVGLAGLRVKHLEVQWSEIWAEVIPDEPAQLER